MANYDIQSGRRWTNTSFLGSAVLLLGGLSEGRADVPEAQKPEVQHLLDYLKNSGCKMERNGSNHDTLEAVEHIKKNMTITETKLKPSRILSNGRPAAVC